MSRQIVCSCFNVRKNRRMVLLILFQLFKNVFLLCRSFDVMTLFFVRRSGNSVADLLARNTSSFAGLVWIEGFPFEASTFVSADITISIPKQNYCSSVLPLSGEMRIHAQFLLPVLC